MQHCKSAASTGTTTGHGDGLFRCYIDVRSDEKLTLTGESSIALIHDYSEQAAFRWRTAPSTIRRPLRVWGFALELDWHLGHALVCAAATVDPNVTSRQPPSMSIATVKLPSPHLPETAPIDCRI